MDRKVGPAGPPDLAKKMFEFKFIKCESLL